MTKTPNRSSLSRRVLQAASSFKAMLFRSLFRSSIYESIRPVLSGRMGWLQTLSSLIGRGSEDIHKGGVLRVSAKERAKRSAAREFRRRFVMAEQLELRALMAADLGLDPTMSQQPVAAEVGAMVPGQASQPVGSSNEVVFVDPGVTDPQSLMQGLRAGVEFVMLDGSKDGVAQIAAYLEGKSGIQAIHLVGHGRAGEIYLGTSVLGNGTLDGYATELSQIGNALTADGDILVYGCETAQGTQGQQFLQQLARLTSADVAGSSDITGAANLGGDWDLEERIGDVEVGLFSIDPSIKNYQGVFGTPVVGSTFPTTFSGSSLTIPAGALTISNWNTTANNANTFRIVIVAYANGNNTTPVGTFSTASGTTPANMNAPGYTTGTITLTPTSSGANDGKRQEARDALNAALAAFSFSYAIPASTTSLRFAIRVTDGAGQSAAVNADLTTGATPVVTINNASNPNFTEDGSAVSVAPNGTVSDTDSSNLASMTITLLSSSQGLPPDGASESLTYTAAGGVTGSYDSGTGVLALSGNTTVLNYESILKSLRYSNSSNNPTTTNRLIRVVANDGTNNSTAVFSTVTITAVNDAPTFTGTISGTYTEAGTALAFLSGAAVADVDASNFNGGSVTVSLAAYQTGDVLSINNQGTGAGQIGVSGSNVTFAGATIGTFLGGSASNLVITFNSTAATPAAVQALMGQLRFSSTSNNPTNFGSATTRSATVTLNDGGNTGTGGAQSASVSGTINVSGVNNAPTVTAPGSFSVTEDVASNLVYTGTPFADVDSANLTVTLSVVDGTISGAVATGITLGGTATARTFAGTVSDLNVYFTTAGNITYTTALNSTAQRTLTTSVSDGTLSASANSTINVTAVNDAPTFTGTISGTYTEAGAALAFLSSAAVADVDASNFNGGSVTVSLSAYQTGDVLSINNQGTGAGQIGVSSGNVTFAGATIGTFSGGSASNLVITFNSANATPAAVQALMGQLRYSSTSNNPTNFGNATTRTATVTLNDGGNTGTGGAQSASVSGTINVSGVNNAPTVTAPGSFSVTEDVAGNLVYTGTPFADVDTANLTVTLSVTDGTIIGATVAGITITNNSSSSVSFAGTVSALNTYFTTAGRITYTTALNNTTQRTLTTSVSDGVLSNSASSNINITAVNDAPTLTAGGTLAYTENEAAKVIDSTITVNDVDNATLKGATVTISAGLTTGDILGFIGQNGITGQYNSTTGVLTLTGTASLANYQTALRSVTYRSTSPDPTGTSATRTISWRVDDGSASSNLSNIATSTINITPILSAPRVDLNGGLDGTDTLDDYTQGTPVLLAPGALITDADGGNGMASLVITLTNAFSGDELTMGSVSGLQSNYTGGVLTITPVAPATTATLALFQQALRTVAFNNSTNSPNLTERVIQVQATDAGNLLGNIAVARVSMTDTNDAPVYQNNLVNQTPSVGLPFSYSLPGSSGVPGSVFVDPENQAMTYQAFVASSAGTDATLSPLPAWLTFNSSLMRFYGVAPSTQSLIIRLVATDNQGLSNDSSDPNKLSNFTITPKNTVSESGTEKFFAYVSFPRVFDLVEGANYDNAGFYQEETNSFKTASAPLAGSNFIFYQSTFPVGADPAFFNGNNVAGTLTYLNTSGQVVNIVGVASRPIKTSGNNTRGFYMWVPNRNQAFGTEGAILLVIDANYFANSTVYNSSSDRVDADMNNYLTGNIFSIASASRAENNGPISFVVTRTKTGQMSVQFNTSIGSLDTASANDFTSTSQLVSFTQNETALTKTVTVALVNDSVFEADETFTVSLSNPSTGSRIDVAQATGTILNDDAAPSVSIANAANIEGNRITFTVTRTGNAQAVQTVRYATALATTAPIASPDDFTSTSGVLTFNPGETSKTFTVQTTQDELLEPNETFLVNLTNATGGLTIGTAQATGTIRDDESTVFYYVDPPTPTVEGNAIQFVIRRTGTVQNIDFSNENLPDVGQSITYWTSIRSSDNSEVGDFTGIPIGTPASITFGANDRSVTVTVNTTNDSIYEGDETFGFYLGNPSTLLAGNSTATETNPDGNEVTATIVDNDAAPKFSVVVGSPSSVVEGNPITFIITRDADSEQPQSIDYSTVIRASDSTAINDFTATSGSLTFNPGEFGSGNSKTVTVTTIEDSIAEGPETFGFAISNPTGGAELDPTKTVATGTLLDSNTAPTASNTTVGTVTKPALEDIPYVFGEFDFGYTDGENAPLWSIQVKTLPAIGGTLTGVLQKATTSVPDGNGGTTLGGWTPVAVDEVLTISGPLGVGAGALRYVPPTNANNQTLSDAPIFSVRVSDGVNFSSDTPTTNRGTVTINILPVNDPPIASQENPPAIAHQNELYIFAEFSSFGFQDPVESHSLQSVILTSPPAKGKIKYDGADISFPYEVSADDIMAGKLSFMPGDDAPSETYTSFFYKVRDNGGTANGGQDISTNAYEFLIALRDYRGPKQSVPLEQLVDEDATLVFSTTNGNAMTVSFIGDASNQADKTLTTTVSVGSPTETRGILTLGSTPSGLGVSGNGTRSITLTGSVSQINAALNGLRFDPPANANSLSSGDKHTYTSLTMITNNSTGAGTKWPQDFDAFDIGVRPVNDAPVVVTANATVTRSITEDPATNSGFTVTSLFNASFDDTLDEVTGGTDKNDLAGVAIHSYTAAASKGVWQYSANGTTGWTNISSIAGLSGSLLIPASYTLRFVPVGNFNGPAPSLQAKLVDTSAGTLSGISTVDLSGGSAIGGTTRYSSASVTLNLSVTPVNDSPVATGTASLGAITEDTANPVGALVSSLFANNFSDAADNQTANGGSSANTFAGIAITNYTRASSKGDWQYSSNNGTSWTTISSSISGDTTSMTLLGTDMLRFLPKTDFNGPAPTLTVRLLETPRSISSGATVDVSINGGSTTISSGTVVLSHSVTARNDAPVASGSATLSAINEDTTNPPGATVSSLFTSNYSDSKDQVIGGSNANNFLGIAVQVHTLDAARGAWQYTSGTTWTTLPTVSGNNAILLRATDQIRFVPATNYNGPATPLVVRLLDNSNDTITAQTAGSIVVTSPNGGTTVISEGLVTLTHIVNPVNDPPTSTNNTITILEDEVRPLTNADFGNYSDVENQPFSAIRIVKAPSKGTLQYNIDGVWTNITTGDFSISDASIKFRYIPALNENGSNYTTIEYCVSDGVDCSVSTYTLTINVTPVNDPPISTNDSVSSNEDAIYYFNVSDFGTYSDIENNPLANVQITTLPSLGTLEYNNGTSWVSALNAEITPNLLTGSSATSRLRYTPPANSFGSPFTGFGFKVSDGADYSLSSYTVTINIAPVNDAPVASGSASLASVFKNDTSPPWATVSSLFSGNFSDPLDTGNTTDSFYGVAIRGLTQDASKGTWEYKIGSTIGVVPNSSDASAFVLRGADSLRFVPFADENTPYVGSATPLSVRLIETKSSDEASATGASDASGSTANVSNNGGTSVYSAATVALNHEVKGTLLVKAFNDVSEGSDAIFRVSLDSNSNVGGTSVTLGLTDGTASSSTDYGPGYREAYYYDNSSNKQTLTISENVLTLPQNVTVFYVSVPTTNDTPKVFEGPETFSLSASITAEGTPISNSDAATIRDDGNGKVFNEDGTVNNSATPDNDLSVFVTGYGPVNEGSTYAMFKVDAASGDGLNFSVINGTATLVTPTIEFSLDGLNWTVFNASATGGFPTVPAGAGNIGTVYVRVTITSESDSMYEGSESFSLRATSRANSSVTATAATSIIDNGTGLKYTGNFTGTPMDPATDGTNLDNDLSVQVTSYSPVNEGSTWAMFKVVAAAGDTLNLDVVDIGTILSPTPDPKIPPMWFSTDGTNWTLYETSNRPVVPGVVGTGTVYVRVNITAEQETALDTGEIFTLVASSNGQGNKSGSANTTILDNGSGTVFNGLFGNDLPQISNVYRDDDRLLAVADKVFNSIPATVTLSDVRVNDTIGSLTISELIGLNPTSSTVSSTVTTGQGTWTVLSGGRVQFVPAAGQKTDPTPLSYAISPDGGANYSRNTAKLYVDYGAVTQADSVDNVALDAPSVNLDVLSNDNLGDTVDSGYLKILNPATNALVDSLVVSGQGTWSVVDLNSGTPSARKGLQFVPLRDEVTGRKSFAGDPTPVRYIARDIQVSDSDGVRGGNPTIDTLASIRYRQDQVQPTFFIRIDDWTSTATRGWNVIVVDNLDAGQSVTIQVGVDAQGAAITLPMTTTHKDMDNTVGIIYYEGALPSYSVVKVDARSKPVTTGSVADIRISSTTQSTRAASIEIQAADQGFVSAGSASSPETTNRLSSPLSGNQAGTSVRFRETLGLSNQGLPGASESTAAVGSRINNDRTITNRSISSGFQSSTFTTTGQQVSLMKSLLTINTGASQITSLTAGGKIINDEMSLRERLASLEWVTAPELYGVGVSRAGAQFSLVPMTTPSTQSLSGSQKRDTVDFKPVNKAVSSSDFPGIATRDVEQTELIRDLGQMEKTRINKTIRLNKNTDRSLIDRLEEDQQELDL